MKYNKDYLCKKKKTLKYRQKEQELFLTAVLAFWPLVVSIFLIDTVKRQLDSLGITYYLPVISIAIFIYILVSIKKISKRELKILEIDNILELGNKEKRHNKMNKYRLVGRLELHIIKTLDDKDNK